MLVKITVFVKYTSALKKTEGLYPVLLPVVSMIKYRFLKEKNIRDRLRSGCAECVLREPYAAEEIRFSGQLTAERIIVLIHSSGGSDKRHYSAGFQLVD